MSVCAIVLAKDEADTIGAVVRHLREHVDEVVVSDNRSSDETASIAEAAGAIVLDDPVVGYWQSQKTTLLAGQARERGHEWVVPCDADEVWHPCDLDLRIRDVLEAQEPSVGIVAADLFDHVATPTDAYEDGVPDDPIDLLRWRRRAPGRLPKVAVRLWPGLVIEQGNHGAHFPGPVVSSSGLAVRHFPYRSVDQFARKVRNGAAAYAATDLPWSMGQHWREYAQHLETGGEDAIREIFETWFYVAEPERDSSLIYDPAPILR